MRSKSVMRQAVALKAMLLLVGACQINLAGCFPRAEFEKTVELEHPLGDGSTLAVSTASGSIDVTGQETDRCHVIATIRARAATEEEAQELAEQVVVRFEQSAEKLEIKADRPKQLRNKSIGISYRVTVPHRTGVQCSSASGSLDLTDLTGDVNAHTASGSVEAARITGSVRLDSASGSVRAEEITTGEVRLSSASGSLGLSRASAVGGCEMHAASGSVAANDVEADTLKMHSASGGVRLSAARARAVSLSTGSGNIRAESLDCTQFNAETSSGNISVGFSPSAPGEIAAKMRATSGNVTLSTPPDFAGQLDLSANSGTVHLDLPVTIKGKISRRHVSGTVGEGAGRLSVRTSSGSIRVK